MNSVVHSKIAKICFKSDEKQSRTYSMQKEEFGCNIKILKNVFS
jgi:hypothetical protein